MSDLFLLCLFLISFQWMGWAAEQHARLSEPAVCGGFLKIDPSISVSTAPSTDAAAPSLHLESVSIGLVSSDGILRFTAKANAHNGYYLL